MSNFIQTSDDFISICKQLVTSEVKSKLDASIAETTVFDVFAIWYAKESQNHIGVFGTNLPDLKYYVITYNGAENQVSLDTYIKFDNKVYQVTAPKEPTETAESDTVSAEE